MDVSGFNWAAIPDKNDQEQIEANLDKRLLDIGEEKTKLIKEATGKLPKLARGIFADFICSKLGFGQTAAKIKELDKEKFAIYEIRKTRTEQACKTQASEVPKIGELIKATKGQISYLKGLDKNNNIKVSERLAEAEKQLAGLEFIQQVTNKVLKKPVNTDASPSLVARAKALTNGLRKSVAEIVSDGRGRAESVIHAASARFSKQPLSEERVQALQTRLNQCKSQRLEREQFSSDELETPVSAAELERLQKKLNTLKHGATPADLEDFVGELSKVADKLSAPRKSLAPEQWSWSDLSTAVKHNNRQAVEALLNARTFDLEELSDAREDAEESGFAELAHLLMQKEVEVMGAAPASPSGSEISVLEDDIESALADVSIAELSTSEDSQIEDGVKTALTIIADADGRIEKRKAEIEEIVQQKIPRFPEKIKQRVIDNVIKKDPFLLDIQKVKDRATVQLVQFLQGDEFLKIEVKQFLLDLSKESRVVLYNVIKELGTKLQDELSQAKASKNQESVAALDARFAMLDAVKTELGVIAQENANRHLISLLKGTAAPIEPYSNAELIEGLILSGGSKIMPRELFLLIADAFAESSEKEKAQLVSFAVLWLERNHGVKRFDDAVACIRERLLPVVTEPQKQQLEYAMAKSVTPTRLLVLKAGATSFRDRVEQIAKGALKGAVYRDFVSQAANDLKKIQGRYYVAHTADTLFKYKWESTPPEEVAYTESFNKIANFLTDLLLKDGSSAEERANLLKFAVDIGDRARKNGDLATAIMIATALRAVPVERMHLAWGTLLKSQSYEKRLAKLLAVTNPQHGYHDYRRKAALVGLDNVHPYLGVMATDQTNIFDKFKMLVSPETETYAFKHFFENLRGWINDALAGQKKMQLELEREPVLNTDLLTNIEQHAIVADTDFDARIAAMRTAGLEVKNEKFTLE